MRQTIFTLLLACTWSLLCYAQTPYDSFAPEAYRPMLELEEPNQQLDTIFSGVVADLENEMLLLMNVQNGEILAAIPLPDDISKWLSVDPLADKYPNISPYAYVAWNPMRNIDSDGRDIYTFDSDGNFTGNIIKQEGEHIGRIYFSDDNYMDFTFNDKADAQRICTPFSDKYFSFSGKIDDNAITHVKFIISKQINNVIPKESAEQSNLFNAIMYAWSESRGGKLDFVNQPSSFLQNDGNTLFLPMDGMNVGYNSFDFGNYLWGQSMQRLNIPLSICLFGANVDNLLNHWPQLDSNADQQAIRRGYMFKMIGK